MVEKLDLGRKLTETEQEFLETAKKEPSKLLPICQEMLCCSNPKKCEKEGDGKCIKGVGIISAVTYMRTAGLCDTAIKAAFIGAYGNDKGEKLYDQFG